MFSVHKLDQTLPFLMSGKDVDLDDAVEHLKEQPDPSEVIDVLATRYETLLRSSRLPLQPEADVKLSSYNEMLILEKMIVTLNNREYRNSHFNPLINRARKRLIQLYEQN